MPKDNIERAIKEPQTRTPQITKKCMRAMVHTALQCTWKLRLTTTTELWPTCVLISTGWRIGHHRGVEFMFGGCAFQHPGQGRPDDLTLELIDVGAEEVERDEEAQQIIISAPFESFGGFSPSSKQMDMKLWSLLGARSNTKALSASNRKRWRD